MFRSAIAELLQVGAGAVVVSLPRPPGLELVEQEGLVERFRRLVSQVLKGVADLAYVFAVEPRNIGAGVFANLVEAGTYPGRQILFRRGVEGADDF